MMDFQNDKSITASHQFMEMQEFRSMITSLRRRMEGLPPPDGNRPLVKVELKLPNIGLATDQRATFITEATGTAGAETNPPPKLIRSLVSCSRLRVNIDRYETCE
jgi:hypothetical protein